MGLAFSRIWERMFGKKEMVTFCVQINQCVATPSSRRSVDGVEDDAAIQHERAAKFLFPHSYRRISFLPNMRSQMREKARPMVDLPF